MVSFGDEDRSHVAALINPSLRDFMGAFASVIDQCDRVIVHNIEVTISQDVLEIEEENE